MTRKKARPSAGSPSSSSSSGSTGRRAVFLAVLGVLVVAAGAWWIVARPGRAVDDSPAGREKTIQRMLAKLIANLP